MAVLADIVNYCNYGPSGSTGPSGPASVTGCYYAVAQWAGGPTGYAAGTIVRQAALPAIGSERCFVALTGGTGSAGTEPTWVTTRGGTVTDSTVLWMEATGIAALNGDLVNTPTWTLLKNSSTPTVGTVIKANDGSSIQICQTAGTLGASQPAFSATPGVRTVETAATAVWISLGTSFPKWASPHARVANAMAANWEPFGLNGQGNPALAAGSGVTYVGDNHAESQATTITIAPILSPTGPYRILDVDHTIIGFTGGNLKTTASISTTAAAALNISALSGTLYCYGINFSAGSAAAAGFLSCAPANALYYMDNCNFILGNTNATTAITINSGSSSAATIWNNCSVKFAAAAQYISLGFGTFLWQNSTALQAGSTVPTGLLGQAANGRQGQAILEGVDLSTFSGQFNNTTAVFNIGNYTLKDCKLNTSMTIGTPIEPLEFYQLMNCELGATGTAYKSARYQYEAIETTETAITRVGGAVDPAGNAQSRKIVTTPNVMFLRPYRAEQLAVYNSKVAANVTVTVYGTWNVASVPNNDDIWMEVEYLGTASPYPLGVIISTAKATLLTANAALTSDGSTWNGGGSGGGWSPFSMSVQLDTTHNPQPQFAGLINVRVRAAKISSTFYIDPKIVLS